MTHLLSYVPHVTTPTTPHPWRHYVALGDSFTEGLQDRRPDGTIVGWADRLAQGLADTAGEPLRYANLAIRGRLLGPIIDEQVGAALALEPDLVSLVGGGNDLLRPGADTDALAAQLEAAVAQFRAAGVDVLLATGVDPVESPIIRLTRSRVAISNANIAAIARRHGAYLLDQWSLGWLRDWRLWDADRLHLNPRGHTRLAQAALIALGLPPTDPAWDTPLPPPVRMTRTETAAWNLAWTRDYLRPWLVRRIRRTSSGAGRSAKQPTYRLLQPTGSNRAE